MKIDKIKILILVFLALTGYFIWGIFHKSNEPEPGQVSIPSTKKTNEGPPFSQEKWIYMPSDETAPLFFKNVYEAAKTAEIKLKDEINAAAQTALIASSSINIAVSMPTSTSTPNEIILSLTDKEFHRLYPDSFIKSLVDAQSLFVKNLNPSYEPILKIETDSQVRLIEEKIVSALVSLNMFTEEEGRQAIITIRFTLPELQQKELKNQLFSFSNEYFNFMPSTQSNPKNLFLSGLIEKLYSALIPKAEAAVCGVCYTLPECYQLGSPSPVPGINIFKPFCYCTGCYYGQGCLDMCSGGAAIFDPTTFICGCGY